DAGGGSYVLTVSVDPAFLATATFPVMVDPGQHTFTPSSDTYIDSGTPDAHYETEPTLGVEYTNPIRYSFIKFDTHLYDRPDGSRVVEAIQMSLLPTSGGTTVNAR